MCKQKSKHFDLNFSQIIQVGAFCGGSILTKNIVLTAAHCLEFGAEEQILVIAGSNNILQHKFENRHKILNIFESSDTETHDIALLEIHPPFDFSSEKVQPIEIGLDYRYIQDKKKCNMAGWGHLNKKHSHLLKAEEVIIKDSILCREIHGEMIKHYHICAGSSNKDACHVSNFFYQTRLKSLPVYKRRKPLKLYF